MNSSSTALSQLERRAEQREQRVADEKAKIDEAQRRKLDEQQAAQEKELAERKAAAMKRSELAKAQAQARREEHAKELEKLQLETDAINKKLKEELSVKGGQEVEKSRAELVNKRNELAEKMEEREKQLKSSSSLADDFERRRQQALEVMAARRRAEQRAHEEKLLALDAETNEGKLKREDNLTEMDVKRHAEERKRVERNDERMKATLMDTRNMLASLQLEDGFQAFQTQCKTLRRQHRNFCAEFDLLEPELLQCDQRLQKGLGVDCDMKDLLDRLSTFTDVVADFNAAGSTKEEEFEKMIGDLTKIANQITTELNLINMKLQANEEGDKTAKEGEGIMPGILKAKELMAAMSPIIQQFNVIGANKAQEVLTDQLQALCAGSSSSSRLAVGAGAQPPKYTEKLAALDA